MVIADAMPPSRTGMDGATAPALAVHRLHKRFPGVIALDDVSLAIGRGRVHGLVGQNGAGKSTLINILSGMLAADHGTIEIDGAPVAIRSPGEAQSLGIATVYQELSLLPNLTVAENIVLGREPRRRGFLDRQAMRRETEAVLTRLDLAIAPDAIVGRLSLAERQMIEIAKALATRPRLLILDEPTAPLGRKESDLLFDAIARIRREGVAILYVSHRFAEVLALCDEATVLRNGRVVTTTSLAGWSEGDLTEAMIGAEAEAYHGARRSHGDAALVIERLALGHQVRGVSFTVRAGEIVALTGLLGAGHNEVARCIGGEIRPSAGTIAVHGRAATLRSPRDAIRAGLCLLTDDRKGEGILPNRSLGENIAVASLAAREGPAGVLRLAEERAALGRITADYGVVAAGLHVPMHTLSGGNQQKALLARWALADVDILILIEPTRGVDAGARADIYRRLDAIAAEGRAILVVTSDLREALTLADRILIVRDGAITAECTPAEVDEERLNLRVQGVEAA